MAKFANVANNSMAARTTKPSKILKDLINAARTFQNTEDAYLQVSRDMWVGLDTPVSLACFLLLKYGEVAQLANKSVEIDRYLDPKGISVLQLNQSLPDDYQAVSILSKWPNFSHKDLDPVGRCIQSDEEAEENCRLTNRRLRNALLCPEGHTANLHLLFQMQADIKRTLGDFDPTEWSESCRFGPGKAQGQPGTLDYEKLIAQPSCTEEFLPYAVALISESDCWLDALNQGTSPDPFECFEGVYTSRFEVTLVQGDTNSMVPKNAKTHRGIRAQPGLNVFAQLGLGNMIRSRLLDRGLDLNTQKKNQELAQKGSLRGSSFVTLDLKSASGHISKGLVHTLFEDSRRWLHAMELCRTHLQLPHKGSEYVPLHSYSAMGNGFTFELESLIFWTAVRVCRRTANDSSPYVVHGDDIVCGKETAELLIPLLEFLGFPLNKSKSFLEGPFRESCGADYLDGINIRPIYLRRNAEDINEDNLNGTALLQWLQTCNAIRRYASLRNHGFGCDRRFLACWRTAALRIPRDTRNSLKSFWVDDQDTTLITHAEDAMQNPLLRRCTNLQQLVGPRLYARRGNVTPRSFFGMRAALLYRQRGDMGVGLYDRNWSDWHRVSKRAISLQYLSPTAKKISQMCGIVPGAELDNMLLPSRFKVSLGGGWEVTQSDQRDYSWY